jgi:hypothetical protein
MSKHVSHHAVIRYVERVLGHDVEPWLVGMDMAKEEDRASHCCIMAGVHLAAVRELILCPPVRTACAAGFKNVTVRFEGFAYVILDGKVVTILTEDMRDQQFKADKKLRHFSRDEMRREFLRNNKRLKGKNKARDRRRLAEVQ